MGHCPPASPSLKIKAMNTQPRLQPATILQIAVALAILILALYQGLHR